MVVYAGKIVESAATKTIFSHPWHPYTIGLMGAVPRVGKDQIDFLANIRGAPPSLIDLTDVCAFQPRCLHATEKCLTEVPELKEMGPGHFVRCLFPRLEGGGS
jgi:oligopeptide/dipeptide ABC transporter ATP-binding protein